MPEMKNPPKNEAKAPGRARKMVTTTIDVLGVPVKAVCDPVIRVCYPALEKHWQDRYRKYWPDRFARRMLILDFALLTLVASLIVFAAATWLLLPFFPGVSNVRLEVFGPEKLTSGRTETYTVSYVNDSPEAIGCASLHVHLPEGAVLTADLPPRMTDKPYCNVGGASHGTVLEEPSGTVVVFDIGTMAPETNGLATFDAAIYAPTGSDRAISAELLYWREADVDAARTSVARAWTVTDSPFRLGVTPPTELVRGRVATVTYDYENATDAMLPPITLRLTRPDDFVLTGASLSGLRGEWTLGALEPREKGTFVIHGYFADTPSAASAPVLTLEALVSEGVGGIERTHVLEAVSRNLDPKASGFRLTQDLGGAGATRGLVPGQRVAVRVAYANDGTEPLRDVTISLYTDGRLIEQAEPAELTWDKSSVPELALLAPGASGELAASFVVRTDLPADPAAAVPTLAISTIASFSHEGSDEVNKAATATVTVPLASRLGVEAAALYYTKDGDQLGVGPLPPKVGQTTKYRVVLQLTNTSGPVEDAVLEAVLPDDVAWTGNYSVSNGEAIDWLPASRKIRWHVGDLQAYAGSVGEYLGASFEVAITPGPDAAGHAAPLLTDISVHGHDATTGLALHVSTEAVTTELPFDPRAAGKGTVEPN
jgi:hypothetical protein